MLKRSARSDLLRRALAQEAARIMAQHGVADFLLAKRKAAERMGVTDRAVLPKNTEIEAALAEHHRLFDPESHEGDLVRLRRNAIAAMRLLVEFEPRLVGPVLSGAAAAHSEIQLHVFADTPESVTIRLIEQFIPHKVVERRVRMLRDAAAPIPVIRFQAGEHEVDAFVFPTDGIRQSPFSPVDGKPMRRAALRDVEALVENGPDPSSMESP